MCDPSEREKQGAVDCFSPSSWQTDDENFPITAGLLHAPLFTVGVRPVAVYGGDTQSGAYAMDRR